MAECSPKYSKVLVLAWNRRKLNVASACTFTYSAPDPLIKDKSGQFIQIVKVLGILRYNIGAE